MKTRLLICLLPLFLVSCISSPTPSGSFASLRNRVAESLAGQCEVGAITSDELLGRSFEVHAPDSGCRILVFEREFVTQKEWDKRYAAGTNMFAETLARTNQQPDFQTAQRFAEMDSFLRLPEWSYQGIGINTQVQCPENVYAGMEKDNAAAQGFLREIVSFLKPYR